MSTNQFHYLKYQLPYRRRNQARGLTYRGKPRLRQAHPELAGLDRRTYRKFFMRTWRASR